MSSAEPDRGVTYRDRDSVLLPDGSALALTDAIARLEWQPMLCPTMPHSYVVSTWSSLDRSAFDAILAMIRHSPDTVLAYWRGYQWPTRYWHGPNGFRYWTTPGFAPGSTVLNRTDDVDDTRPVSSGGAPIQDWVGCPWEPQANAPRIYERVESLDGWWPSASAIAAGYRPCRSCQRRPADSWSPRSAASWGLRDSAHLRLPYPNRLGGDDPAQLSTDASEVMYALTGRGQPPEPAASITMGVSLMRDLITRAGTHREIRSRVSTSTDDTFLHFTDPHCARLSFTLDAGGLSPERERGVSVEGINYMRRIVPILASAALLLGLFVGTVSGYTNYGGGWEADPGQGASSFGATVQQPINADGSSKFSSKGGGVIPVKFALTQGTGPFVFESREDAADGPLWSNVVYTPQTATTVNQVTNLSAVYDFTVGDCRGGSLRWQLHTTSGADIYVYFYQVNGTVSCDGANSQSGTNIVGLGGNVDYTGAIGSYVDWTDMLANSGLADDTVEWAALIIDSGWGGDQVVDLTSATFNTNTFTVPGPASGGTVCPMQQALFSVEKLDGSATASVTEATSIQPKDDNGVYRIVDCKYMYNLATSSLRGSGTYVVKATIDNSTFEVARFDLK